VKPGAIPQETLDAINEVLATATPMGAYAVGIVCSLAWQVGKQPPVEVLKIAVQCVKLDDAIDWHRLTTTIRDARLA
jgi:hypothetical protein